MAAYRYYRPRYRYGSRRLSSGEKLGLAVAGAAVVFSTAGHGAAGIAHPARHADRAAVAITPGQVSTGSNVALGRQLAPHGWRAGAQWNCLDWLWTRESGWSNTAENPKSGAFGIAQALGHGPTNQYPAGPANPPQSDPAAQIRWGLGYIQATYGTPCAAWAHEEADSWY